jgi:hypothetical protein
MGITHLCFGLSFLTALGCEVAQIFHPARWFRILGIVAGSAGLIAQTIFLIYAHPSPATAEGALLLLAWVLAIFYLYGALHQKRRPWSLFVLPLVLLMVGAAYALAGSGQTFGRWYSAEHFWGATHGILVLASCVGIAVGFLASVMYLIQSRRLRMKRPPLGIMKLWSLERLEMMNRRAITGAFPFLTVGLLIGVMQILMSDVPSSWTDAKIITTIGLWAVAFLLLYLRYHSHLPPRRLAILTIIAFVLMIVTLTTSHPVASGEVVR